MTIAPSASGDRHNRLSSCLEEAERHGRRANYLRLLFPHEFVAHDHSEPHKAFWSRRLKGIVGPDCHRITFQVTSLEPLIAYLHVPEREYRRIARGQTAVIEVDALQGSEFNATVARISPVIDPATGTFKITVEVSDPSRRLKPGMFGRINIVYDMHPQALQVPRSAIIDEAGETSVFIIEDEKAVRRSIKTGYANSGRIEILDGLTGSEMIVIVGQAGLREGSKVAVINAVEVEESAANNSSTD